MRARASCGRRAALAELLVEDADRAGPRGTPVLLAHDPPPDLADPPALLGPLEVMRDEARRLLAARGHDEPFAELAPKAERVVGDQERAAGESLEDAVVPHPPLALRVLVVVEDDRGGAVEPRDVVERQR